MKNALQLPWLDRFYLIRVTTVLMILAIVAVRDMLCMFPAAYHPTLFFFGIAYPHLIQLVLGRFEGRRLRGRYSLLVDGLFAGAAMPVLGFSVVPCVVLAVINLFNWMALGGTYLAMLGTLALLSGLGLSGAFAGFGIASSSCVSADSLSFVVLLAYFLLVASIVFRYSTTLRKHCDELQAKKDAAEMGCRRAEQALMAILPPSAALEHSNGGVQNKAIADATLLLVDLTLPGGGAGDIAKLQAIFGACDEILFRHGMETVKTFGRRCLALAGKQAGPEDALVAALEIATFVKDHGVASGSSEQPCRVRVAIHSGPVVAGLVQAEKINYDILGATVDEILALADAEGEATVLISAAARQDLRRDWRLALLPGTEPQPVFTPMEHGVA